MDKKERVFSNDLEMLKYFQDEFQFRVQHYWNILIRLFTLSIIITVLPVASEVCGITLKDIPLIYKLCCPGLGLVVSILALIILLEEAKKTQSANEAKYRINKKLMQQDYHYEYYDHNIGEGTSDKKQWMSYRIPFYTFICNLLIIILVVGVLICDYM